MTGVPQQLDILTGTPTFMALLHAPLIACAVALFGVWWLSRRRVFALDYPNQRSLHQSPLPRTGGLGLHAGIAAGASMAASELADVLIAGWVILIAISFFDDLYNIAAGWRLFVHLCAAALVAGATVYGEHGLPIFLVSTLAIGWMTNLYNFMDGSDGLAGGMTFFGFTFYGIASWLSGAEPYTILNFSIAASAAAFLVFNFHPARIFMGDVGSVPLGFLASAVGLLGAVHGYWPWWFPVLVFSPFVVDASITLLRRALHRQRIWEAHRDHYYQRLVQLGWGHRRTACAEYLVMVVCGAIALCALSASPRIQTMLLGTVAAGYALLVGGIEHVWRNRARGQ